MDVDELDELVDYEEDAMMTDAIEDAGGEIDMDPVDVEDDHEKLDDDEEMTQADNNAPEGTTGKSCNFDFDLDLKKSCYHIRACQADFFVLFPNKCRISGYDPHAIRHYYYYNYHY
jgi:hypothetical protein